MATKKSEEQETIAEAQEAAAVRAEEDTKPARFIRASDNSVVDAEGKVVEGLSVKNGEITGTEK